jgi:hypothetical protein
MKILVTSIHGLKQQQQNKTNKQTLLEFIIPLQLHSTTSNQLLSALLNSSLVNSPNQRNQHATRACLQQAIN